MTISPKGIQISRLLPLCEYAEITGFQLQSFLRSPYLRLEKEDGYFRQWVPLNFSGDTSVVDAIQQSLPADSDLQRKFDDLWTAT